ncbi:MAG TPA: hypothetical protein GXX37_00825 [Clostridiaceae bacterium]|nr:hypothetical protein [Clostridiaceae bacterium]
MRTKRFLFTLLAIVIMISLIACTSKTGSDKSKEASETSSQEVSGSEKHMTISYATTQVVEGVDYNGDELSKYFMDKFNIDWEIIPLSGTQARE